MNPAHAAALPQPDIFFNIVTALARSIFLFADEDRICLIIIVEEAMNELLRANRMLLGHRE